ncbi:MAG: hypothetical protein AAGA96_11680, partial [Verrucomicrobiota bacterium]
MTRPGIALLTSLASLGLFLVLLRPNQSPSHQVAADHTAAAAPDPTPNKENPEAVILAWQGSGLAPPRSKTLQSEIKAFDEWVLVLNAVKDDTPLTPAQIEEGIRLAEARRPVLKQLIQTDPEAALAAAVPWVIRNRLPTEILDLLEDRVSATADFSVLAAVPRPGQTLDSPALTRTAVIDGQVMQAYVYGDKEAVDTKQNLPVDGISIDDQLAILDATLRPLEEGEPIQGPLEPVISPQHDPGESAIETENWVYGGSYYELCCGTHTATLQRELELSASSPGPEFAPATSGFEVSQSSWTEGTKSLLVIRVDFSDLAGAPRDSSNNVIDAAYLVQRVNDEIADWIEEVSYSKGSMTLGSSDVTGVLRMPQTAATYAAGYLNDSLRIDALALASSNGFNPDNYDRVALVFSDLSSLPASLITYGGLGQVGGSFTWYNGNFSFGIATHEFGHNYGLRHANRWQIPGASSNPVDPSGSSTEYGDVFDMMGSGPSDPSTNADHFNPWFLNRLDWLTDSSIQTVSTGGTYRIYRYDHQNANAANPLALKIDRSASENYWIGYRRKFAGHPSRGDV